MPVMYGNSLPLPSGSTDPNEARNTQAAEWIGSNAPNPQNFGGMGPPPPNWGMATVIPNPSCFAVLHHQQQNPAQPGNYYQHGWPMPGQWGPVAQVHSGYGVPAMIAAQQYGVMPRPAIPPPRPPPLPVRAEVSVKQPWKKKNSKSQQKGPRLYRSRDDVDKEKQQMEDEQMNSVAVQKPKTKEELEEVLRWLEDRRRNFPTQENIKRKAEEAKLMEARGELNPKQKHLSLQDIIEKQKQMGLDRIAGTNSMFSARGRGSSRGRRPGRGGPRSRGKRNWENKDSIGGDGNKRHQSNTQVCRRAPSLVEKLLYKDIQKDKSQILQCIRFLVENDFLQNLGKVPLVYHDSKPHKIKESKHEASKLMETTFGCADSDTSDSDADMPNSEEGIDSSSSEEGEI